MKTRTFRDFQEQTAEDHNSLQEFQQAALDAVVKDAVTDARAYAGFAISKTTQTDVRVEKGRVYGTEGDVYELETFFLQSMTTYLAAASSRIVAVSAYGAEIETDMEERDFLINVATGATEPRTVAMTRARIAQLSFTPGAEAPEPSPPAIPASHVLVGYIYVSTTAVTQVVMNEANAVNSTRQLAARTRSLEAFRDSIGPRVNSLSSDLSSLQNQLLGTTAWTQLRRVIEDVARVKQALRFPNNAAGFGADFFLIPTQSDTANSASLGYDAAVAEGVRFANANANQFEMSLFSANDPNASLVGGLLLPRYTDDLKIQTGDFVSELGISQYGFQTITQKVGFMSRTRVRYGGAYTVCTNGNYWDTIPGQPAAQNLYDFETTNITTNETLYANGSYTQQRKTSYWIDSWKEPYLYALAVDQTITGALVAQTFLNSNDLWATKLGFWIVQKGANENIRLALCEVTNGVPDTDKVITTVTYPHANIVSGWNETAITPTFLQKGKRYALVFVSNANHKIGMTSGQSYLDGTFFYSTDGQYFAGDLTKDMMLRVYGARFNAPQVTIELAPITLDGGFRSIDILAEQWAPESTQLIPEMRPNGGGEWQPIVADNAGILATAPPLAQFRLRFVGTRDMMPAIKLTGSRVRVARPKTAATHVSTPFTTPAATTLTVKVLLEDFDPVPHTFALALRHGGAGVNTTLLNPASTVSRLIDAAAKRYERTYTFTITGITTFRQVMSMTTNSAQSTFHVAEMVYSTN